MITKSDLSGMFNRFIIALDHKHGRLYRRNGFEDTHYIEGGIYLDYNSIYGGYVIVEIGPGGSESHPFGQYRVKTKEMYHALELACKVLEYKRDQQEILNKYEIA